jgi:hypothetical protein
VEGKRKLRQIKKTNPNHYPDPQWVWNQIEKGITGEELYDKMDVKYSLKAHGNLGKKQNRTGKYSKKRNENM